jgi:hypothetical protein
MTGLRLGLGLSANVTTGGAAGNALYFTDDALADSYYTNDALSDMFDTEDN